MRHCVFTLRARSPQVSAAHRSSLDDVMACLIDCLIAAAQCGAKRVYVAFRKGMQGMRAVPEEVQLAVDEKVEFLPFVQVKACHTDPDT